MVLALRVGLDSKQAPAQRFRSGPLVEPASVSACVDALQRICAGGGGPRWAATGWAVDLVGPWRSVPRVGEPGEAAAAALDALLRQLQPEPARTVWPDWLDGRQDQVLLGMGVSAGKPDKRQVVDIPAAAAHLVVDIGGGLVRFRHPAWRGDALTADGRLVALSALVRWRGDVDPADVRELVRWCAGRGRAWCGSWAARQGLREAHSAAARAAAGGMSGVDVDQVVAGV